MELTPGMKITPDMLKAGESQPQGLSTQGSQSLTPGMKIDPSMLAPGSVPQEQPRALMQNLKDTFSPTIGLAENVANQVTNLGALSLTAIPNIIGSAGAELADAIVNQRMPTLSGIADKFNENVAAQTYQPQTEAGQKIQAATADVLGAIPKALDAVDELTGDNFKKNFPNIYAATQVAGEFAPYMVLGKGFEAGMHKGPVNEVGSVKLDFPEQVQLESASVETPASPVSIEVNPDITSIAQQVVDLATSPVLSKTEQAAKMVDRISEIQGKLEALNIDPQTASPELLQEAGKLQALKDRIERSYSNVQEELGGESSPFEPAIETQKPDAQDTIQNSNLNLVANEQVIKAAEDHLASTDNSDSTVYASPSLQAHGNLVEDLLLSSGIKSKVAILDRGDLGSGEGSVQSEILKPLADRLDSTNNYGVVKRLEDGSYVAVINKASIEKSGGARAARVLEATLHEAFGHVVVGERYESASAETKIALQKDFERYTKLSPEEATKAFYPIKTGEIALGVPEDLNGSHFKEWLVNGITKWATSEADPVGLANKWFKKLADVFKKAFSKASDVAQTPESIRTWMNSMFDARRLEDVVEAKPVETVEPHSSPKALSMSKQLEKLKAVVSKEDLSSYEIGKVEGKDQNTLGVYKKDSQGNKLLINEISSTSRSSARRQAELFTYAHALASRGLDETTQIKTKRQEHYSNLLSQAKDVFKDSIKDTGESVDQKWLSFVSDPKAFMQGDPEVSDRIAKLDKQNERIFSRIEQAIERDDKAVKKAILFDKRVVPAEVQELVKAEPILKEEFNEGKERDGNEKAYEENKQGYATQGGHEKTLSEGNGNYDEGNVDRIQNSNLNFENRIIDAAQESAFQLTKVGSKVNLERLQNSVQERLRLEGKDLRDMKKFLKENYEDLKAGKLQVSEEVSREIEKNIEEQKVPDEVSLEEAQAYMDLLDMAVRRKKSGPITGPFYEKVIKAKRTVKQLTEDQISEKIKARLAKEKEFVEKTSILEKEAERANLSLSEYLQATAKGKDGNPISFEDTAKIVRKYQRLAKTIFTDTEHIIRLGRELGLVDSVTGMNGLEAFIRSEFPKAQGPLKQLTIVGRDILMKKMQDAWFKQTGEKFDFRQFKSMRELQADQVAAMNSRSGWDKFKHGISYFMNTAMDELQTTPAGAQLVQLIRNKITTENALYLRDYMKRLNEIAEKVTDPQDREHILDVYEGRAKARNPIFQKAADLMHEIYTAYGTEMERLGVRIQYKGGYQADFKFDPNKTHYPHMWEPGAFDKPSDEMINSLIVSGEKVDPKQARAIISQFGKRQTRLAAPRFANLEMAREVEMGGYIKDPIKVTTMYLNRGASRLAILREFGQNPEVRLAQLAWDHFMQSKDPDQLNFAVKVINSVTGVATHEPLMKRALNIVGVAEFTAMASALQHAAIIQPSIISNLAVTTGWKNTIKGFYRYIKADPRKASMSKEWADVLGASGRSVGKELMDELGTTTNLQHRADKLLNFWKVTTVDRWLRDASTLVGQLHVNEMLERAINFNDTKAHKELSRVGLEAAKVKEALDSGDDKLVEDYIKKGSYAFSQRTNLLTDPLSRPLWQMERTSWGGLLTLFGRFGFLQHHFLKGLIKDGATKTDSAGRLAKYLAYATAVGVPIYTARQLAKGVNPVEDFAEKGLFGFMFATLQSGGGLGLFADAAGEALMQIAGGQSSNLNERFGGPLAGLAKETATGVGKIAQGELNNAQALRLLLRAGVVTGVAKLPEKYIPAAGALGLARPMLEHALADKQTKTSMFK